MGKSNLIKALKFRYSEKATNFWKNVPLFLTLLISVKTFMRFFQNFVAFSEYLNFTDPCTRVMRFNIQTQFFLFQFSKSAFISKWKVLIIIEKVNFRHFFPIVLSSHPAKFFSAKLWQRYFDNGRFAQNQVVLFGEIGAFLCDDMYNYNVAKFLKKNW